MIHFLGVLIKFVALHIFPVDEIIQFTAILWLREFLTLAGRAMIPFCGNILMAVLPCVSYEHCKFSILSSKLIARDVKQFNEITI